mmetsp:Transcript_8345/g.11257  ORF Transcript_8345/g.11257 Transcript_8345/m.11257 type:complete len:196 (-) Transcript_8345:44-631(-)
MHGTIEDVEIGAAIETGTGAGTSQANRKTETQAAQGTTIGVDIMDVKAREIVTATMGTNMNSGTVKWAALDLGNATGTTQVSMVRLHLLQRSVPPLFMALKSDLHVEILSQGRSWGRTLEVCLIFRITTLGAAMTGMRVVSVTGAAVGAAGIKVLEADKRMDEEVALWTIQTNIHMDEQVAVLEIGLAAFQLNGL